jgi:23S rRNA U2552 (ribose-2'-O)-methylase RlmE/FtsJ
MLLSANDQVTISNTEDNLQRAAYKLYEIMTEHGLITSVQKNKTDGI